MSVELFLYLLFPLILRFLLRHPGRSAVATLAVLCVLGAAVSYAWNNAAAGISLLDPEPAGPDAVALAELLKFNPLLHLPEFVAGILLYSVWQRGPLPLRLRALVAIMAAMLCLLLAFASDIPQPLLHNGLAALVWAPLILIAARIRSGPLVARPLLLLGEISYPVYLLHMPTAALAHTLDHRMLHDALATHPWVFITLASAVTLSASVAVHFFLEAPARKLILRVWVPGRLTRRV